MNMKLKYISTSLTLGLSVMAMVSCTTDPNSPGVEYMPDMYRSPAVEAYVDYDNNEAISARKPVPGTIPFSADDQEAAMNMPYPYPNTTEGYEMAGEQLTSPLAFSAEYVAEGKEIYSKFCQHCHGEEGQGDGAVVTNGGYPPPPAYNGAALKELPEGKMFHTITYGKGQMGSHASQLSKEERWKVIQYVKILQNGGINPFEEGNEEVNS